MNELFDAAPFPNLQFRLLWEAMVDLAPMEELGSGPYGERRIVPIIGGGFRGGPDLPGFHGEVLPGGADRQLIRADGAKELDALYEMRVQDGTVLTVRNRVLIDETGGGLDYAVSRIEVTAPEGPWGWLGRRSIAGTLIPARPAREAVIIRGWELSTSA